MTSTTVGQQAKRVRAYFSELWYRREFAFFLATGNLKARNAGTVFGLAWWVLNPLLLGGVYFFVFGVIWGADTRGVDYVGYLLTGMFIFHFTAQSMTGGANSILQNSNLLANLRFPRMILPIANLIEGAFGFLAALFVLAVAVAPFSGGTFGWHWAWLLVAFPIHLIFNLGLSSMAARLAVPFRDINNIIPYISRLWLYLSPVIWPLEFLQGQSERIQSLAALNPLFDLMAIYRGATIGTVVEPINVYRAALVAVTVGVVGIAVFVRAEGKMVRYL